MYLFSLPDPCRIQILLVSHFHGKILICIGSIRICSPYNSTKLETLVYYWGFVWIILFDLHVHRIRCDQTDLRNWCWLYGANAYEVPWNTGLVPYLHLSKDGHFPAGPGTKILASSAAGSKKKKKKSFP